LVRRHESRHDANLTDAAFSPITKRCSRASPYKVAPSRPTP
jgi:hypothetical protein